MTTLQDFLDNGGTLTLKITPASDGTSLTFSGNIATDVVPPVVAPVMPPVVPPVVPVVPPVIPPVVPPIVPLPSPAAYAQTTHPTAVLSMLKTAFPYATNAWWENIILGKSRIAPDPYQVEVVDNGFLVCYPAQSFTQDALGMQHITSQFLQNFTLEFAEHMGSWAVVAYDDLTVTLKWTAVNGQTATSVIAQGCPYMSMSYSGTTPLLTTQHAIVSVNGIPTPTAPTTGMASNTKFKIVLNNGQTWLLYCSSAITFTWSGAQLIASTPFTGVVRLAVLVNATEEATLDFYAPTVPVGGKMSVAYSATAATYTFTWTIAGPGSLLMCAMPHHVDILQGLYTATPTLSRQCTKGVMIGVAGNSWTLVEPLPTIQWKAPRAINPTYLPAIAAQLKKDAAFINNSTSDTYFAGKGLAKMARLLLIADEIGDTDSVALLQKNLKASLTLWLTSGNLFAYDKTWGGIVFAPALGNIGADFGFSFSYNDHVFHLGYFVYACAALAKFDAAWLTTYQEQVTELVHDYCNPLGSSDSRYPQVRNKDLYAGHSWASGIVDFADNRNLESTSEAANGYYAAMLWGLVTGDSAMQNFGALMMAMEIRSAQKYWHVYNNNNVYGSQYTANGVGLVWSTKVDDATWFDAHLSCRRGIQVIPLTAASELYLEPAWIQAMKSSGELGSMQSENFTIWPTFVNGVIAVIDKASAWTAINAMADSQIDDGASRTNLLWWVATR